MIHKDFLFGAPIYHTKVDPKKYDKDKIIDIINNNYSKDSYRNLYDDNLSDLHHSFKDTKNKKFEDIDYKETGLLSVYEDIFKNFVNKSLKTKDKFLYKFTIENYTATKNSQFMRSHQHLPHVDFATVHYLQYDKKNHSNTVFINSNDYGPYASFIRKNFSNTCDDKHIDNSYLFHNWKYKVEEDDMIIFPSFLKHEIPKQKNEIDKLRITVVCNLAIENSEEEFNL